MPIEPTMNVERERERRAQHEHVAVGEVDELEDAVDERVADRDERDDQAVGRPIRSAVSSTSNALSSAMRRCRRR